MDLLILLENLDEKTFCVNYQGKQYCKKEIIEEVEKFSNNLFSITDFKNKKVFLDVNDRLLFIISFFSLLKLKAKIVLVPSEININEFSSYNGIFLSDNKKILNGIFIDKNYHISVGNEFKEADNYEQEEDICFYLYTSGSTGLAKLIPKTAENILVELKELSKILNCEKTDTFFFTPPLCHIYGILFGFFLPFYNSATVFLDYLFSPESINEFVLSNSVSYFISIPVYYKMFVELNLIDVFKKCKYLISSSAPLPLEISKKFYENGIKIVEVYGSTETGGIAHRISAEHIEWKLFSYVKIVEEWDDYINHTEEDKKIVELKIISPGISISYDLLEGYNTGDLVELQKNNKFILLGRNTRFVKIAGKRVDLNYVNKNIIQILEEKIGIKVNEDDIYLGFKDSFIYAIIDSKYNNIDIEALKKELKKRIPSYAFPKVLISEKIPRNNMGKINKVEVEKIIEKIKIKKNK